MEQSERCILVFVDIPKIHVVLDMITKQLIQEVEQVTKRITSDFDAGKTWNLIEKAKPYSQVYRRLREYENAEEEGRMVMLPCKVGDALFCFSRRKVYPFKVRCIRIYEERVEIELRYAGDEENLKFWHITIMEQDVGSKVFLTREEAEKALKEMEEMEDK